MSNAMMNLHDRVERIRLASIKKASEAYAKEIESGINEIAQAVQQAASIPLEPEKKADDKKGEDK